MRGGGREGKGAPDRRPGFLLFVRGPQIRPPPPPPPPLTANKYWSWRSQRCHGSPCPWACGAPRRSRRHRRAGRGRPAEKNPSLESAGCVGRVTLWLARRPAHLPGACSEGKGRISKTACGCGRRSPPAGRLEGVSMEGTKKKTGGGARTGRRGRKKTGAPCGRLEPGRLASNGTRERVCLSRPRAAARSREEGGERVCRDRGAFRRLPCVRSMARPDYQVSAALARAQSRGREGGERVRVLRVLRAGNTGAPGRRPEETKEM